MVPTAGLIPHTSHIFAANAATSPSSGALKLTASKRTDGLARTQSSSPEGPAFDPTLLLLDPSSGSHAGFPSGNKASHPNGGLGPHTGWARLRRLCGIVADHTPTSGSRTVTPRIATRGSKALGSPLTLRPPNGVFRLLE